MKHFKILWIDDSQEWAISAQENLKLISKKNNVEFHFVNAINGEDIVQICTNIDFDLIVMDFDMKPFSGDKYIRDIRFEEHLDVVKILFYSQNNSINLDTLVVNVRNISTIYRPNLEDEIKSICFK